MTGLLAGVIEDVAWAAANPKEAARAFVSEGWMPGASFQQDFNGALARMQAPSAPASAPGGAMTYAAQQARHVGIEDVGLEARRNAFSQGTGDPAQQTADNTANIDKNTAQLLEVFANHVPRPDAATQSGIGEPMKNMNLPVKLPSGRSFTEEKPSFAQRSTESWGGDFGSKVLNIKIDGGLDNVRAAISYIVGYSSVITTPGAFGTPPSFNLEPETPGYATPSTAACSPPRF